MNKSTTENNTSTTTEQNTAGVHDPTSKNINNAFHTSTAYPNTIQTKSTRAPREICTGSAPALLRASPSRQLCCRSEGIPIWLCHSRTQKARHDSAREIDFKGMLALGKLLHVRYFSAREMSTVCKHSGQGQRYFRGQG